MSEESVKRRLRAAIAMLFARDAALLERGAGERSVVAKLASYLAPLFRGYDVDVEYNRHGLETKMLDLPATCRKGGHRRIYPDIIIHRRGSDKANLLVVEVKKTTNTEPRDCDRAKIAGMKSSFGYTLGVLLELPGGKGASSREATETWL